MAETFIRTEEQTMLAGALREMLDAAVDMDRTRELSLTETAFDADVWSALSDMGLVGMALPEQYGGAGSAFTDLAVVFEELGRAVAAVPLLSSVLAMSVIDELGSDDQRSALLPGLAGGDQIGTVAMFESSHSIDEDSVGLTAEQTDDGWRLAGTKRWVTDATSATHFVVFARTSDDLGAFVVPADAGLDIEPVPALDATRPMATVTFETTVGSDARLGGDATRAWNATIALATVALAQEQVGGAQRCLEESVEYAKSRHQFGRAIGSFQAVKHKCADLLVGVEHAKSAAWHAASTMATDESDIAVPLAKSVCSDAYLYAAAENIQIHGGIGFTWEHDAHLYFKRAKSTSLLFGSVEQHRDHLGRALGI